MKDRGRAEKLRENRTEFVLARFELGQKES